MSLVTQISGLATRIGTEIKALRTERGALTALTTTDKSSIVAAINEVDAAASTGITDGDKGDITVSAGGTAWTVDNGAVSFAKMQNVSATDKLLGRATAGAGVVEEIPLTAAGRALIDDADAAAQRTTLGVQPTANPVFTGVATAPALKVTGGTPAVGKILAFTNVDGTLGVANAPAAINDTTPSGTSVYSSTKTDSQIAAATAALVASSPAALDTLDELAAALGDDANFAATTATALGNRVRVDTAAQGLNSTQKGNARTNIDAVSTTDVGDTATNFVTVFEAALV